MDGTIHIVGAGGIGCAVGYALRRDGVQTILVEADTHKVAWARQNGIRVDHHPSTQAHFESFSDWQPHPGDTILLCTKCYDNAAVLARLPAGCTLIPIQNGFDAALHNDYEGIASFISECYRGKSHTRITRKGKLHLGQRCPANSMGRNGVQEPWIIKTLENSATLWKLGIRVMRVPDILPYKYTKLMYNAAISPLAAAAGIDNGDLLWFPDARRLFFQLIRENYRILRRAGTPLGKVGPFHPDTVQEILRRPLVAWAFAWAFYPTLKGSYCSMYADLPRGCTEIDYYNGHLLELAGDEAAPLNRRVYELVKRMERERIVPAPTALQPLCDAGAHVSTR